MPGLAENMARLRAMHIIPPTGAPGTESRLSPLTAFGSNPGALAGYSYVPADLAPGAPLVVVLHGCTQSAQGYDHGAGWSQIAEEQGFALLYPEQRRTNNANLCFNWFEPGDVERGAGEVLSIMQMIETMVEGHAIDPGRVFITGLSAGGAMTAAMLAAYPEVFAGGAIIAGLPSGSSRGVAEALRHMRTAGKSPSRIGAGSPGRDTWPRVSVWHGSADRTVDLSNASAIVDQWRDVHGAGPSAARTEQIGQHTRSVWHDAEGRDAIEYWTIAGMGHGVPLATRGEDACGVAGPHMIDAGISSTRHITRFWGIEVTAKAAVSTPARRPQPLRQSTQPTGDAPRFAAGPQRMIEDALRAAGLMR